MVDANRRRRFETLVAAAFADGYLAKTEMVVLERKAAALQIPEREVHEILGLGQQRKLSISIPATSPEKEALLDDLIDVVGADGRVEAAEYSVLARFADTLKLSLPDLRLRVNRRLQGLGNELASSRGTQLRRSGAPAAAVPAPPPAPPPAPSVAPPPPPLFADAPAPAPHGPVALQSALPPQPKVANLPPVTLQLIKQSIMFDTTEDNLHVIARMLAVPDAEAASIRAAILAAYPDLKPQPIALRPPRK
jgi:uncharacterized tellurite resistance protein B-like protein